MILLTPLSYLPLYRGLFLLRSENGISVTATLLLALCAQSQVATIYYLWACPPFKRDGQVVPKPPLSVDYLNLVQLLLQWICSILLLAFLLVVRTGAQTNLQRGPATATTTTTNDSTFPSNKTAVTLLTLHASLCVFWAILAGQPRDDWLDLPFVTIMGINEYCINPLVTIATGVAFALQIGTAKESQGTSAVNRTTLLPQAVIFLALAVSWPFRFQVPKNLRSQGNWWLVEEWYPLVGWTCINNAVIAIGQGIVLYAASRRADSGEEPDRERQALLTT